MDPNATLRELRDLMDSEDDDFDVERATELFWALDNWLSRGGFLPRSWDKNKPFQSAT